MLPGATVRFRTQAVLLMQVSDLTGSYRLYRKECLEALMSQCTSKEPTLPSPRTSPQQLRGAVGNHTPDPRRCVTSNHLRTTAAYAAAASLAILRHLPCGWRVRQRKQNPVQLPADPDVVG